MGSSSPEPLAAVYHNKHSPQQTSANPQEFAVIERVPSNPTFLSPHTIPGRAPQLVPSPLQHPQSIPRDTLSNKGSPWLLSSGAPQALPAAYTRQSETPSTHLEQPYWPTPPPASPSPASAYLSQDKNHNQQYQHQPYPLPEEQLSSKSTQSGVSHPDDFLQYQQSINHSPGITGASSDGTHKPVYITPSPGRRKRNALWGSCLFIVILAIVLGVVFGVVLKDKKEDQVGGGFEDRSRSRTTSAFTRATGTRTVQPTPLEPKPSGGLTTTFTTEPATQTHPPATSSPIDRAGCMTSCEKKFYDCLDVCNDAQKECEAPCGDDPECEKPCGIKNGECGSKCQSVNRRCKC